MLLKNLNPSSKDQIKLYRYQYSTLTAILLVSLITVFLFGYPQAAFLLTIGSVVTFSKRLSITALTTMELEKLHLRSIGHEQVQEHMGNLFIKQGSIYNYQARSINNMLLASRQKKIAEKITAKASSPTANDPYSSNHAHSNDTAPIEPKHPSPQIDDETSSTNKQVSDKQALNDGLPVSSKTSTYHSEAEREEGNPIYETDSESLLDEIHGDDLSAEKDHGNKGIS